MERVLEIGVHSRHRLRREAAVRKIRGALHEQHRGIGGNMSLDSIDDVFSHLSSPVFESAYHGPLLFGAHRAPRGDFIEGTQTTRAMTGGTQYTDFDAGGLRAFHHPTRDRFAKHGCVELWGPVPYSSNRSPGRIRQ